MLNKIIRFFLENKLVTAGESEKVLNPHFGEMMMQCDEIKHTYRRCQKLFATGEAAEMQPAGGA